MNRICSFAFMRLILVMILAISAAACDGVEEENINDSVASPTAVVAPVTATATTLPTLTATAIPPSPTSTVAVPTATEPSPSPTATPGLFDVATAVNPKPTVAPENLTPHMRLVFDFLTALQNGLTAAETAPYLSRDMQAAAQDGRSLPTVVGIRDAFPSFTLTDLTDNSRIRGAQVRARFNFDDPTYAIFFMIQEDGAWKINSVGQHNLLRTLGSRDLLDVEATIIGYYQALADDQLETAFARLSPAAQSATSLDTLASGALGLNRVTVTTMQPVEWMEGQVSYYVHLFVTPDSDEPGDWSPGDNPRWLILVPTDEDWRIDRITRSPILADIKTWQRITIPPIQMSLDIPADWTRPGIEWNWSPNSLGLPNIGVTWADLGEFSGDESLLPLYRRSLGTQPIDLGWARGTQYTFETLGGIGEGSVGAETHMIVHTGRRAYSFYAAANTVAELTDMRPILERMVAAVSIYDPNAPAFNSVDTSVGFLATLIRDASGNSSLPYLSDTLRAGVSDRQDLLSLLDVENVYRTFSASWLENTVDGRARVLVALNFDAAPTETRLFILRKAADDAWQIIAIEQTE